MLTRFLFLMLSAVVFTVSSFADSKPKLLFYCGITMVKPIKEIAKIIEKKYNCEIAITQGGSRDLYESLKYSKKGDMYLPGSSSYRDRYMKDGYLLDGEYIGFNKAAIFVQKGNPKNIKDLNSLTKEDVALILCDPQSGSIGKMTKKILLKFKGEDFFYDVYDRVVEIGTDSRNLNTSLIEKNSDMSINWRATAFWAENSRYIDIVKIDEKYAPKKKLVINLLKFSKYPKISKAFMRFSSSKEGQKIMKKHGFL